MTSLTKRAAAELIGTFWLVLGGCGSAVLAAGIPALGIGYLGVSLAFGLTVVTMAYAVGHISGGHFNPDSRQLSRRTPRWCSGSRNSPETSISSLQTPTPYQAS